MLYWATTMSVWDAPRRKAISGRGHLGLRIWLALGTAVLAIASLAFPGLHQRIDSTVLLLLVAVPLILLVPWEKMSSLKAVGVEITLNLPQVREAVKSLDTIASATGGDPVDNQRVARALERLGTDLPLAEGARVLWIDDNPAAIVGVRRLFRALGVHTVMVTSSDAADVTLATDNDFDLVISDLMRNDPASCTSFEWACDRAEQLADEGLSLPDSTLMRTRRGATEREVIDRDDGSRVEFEIRAVGDATVHERREGVNFVCRLRETHEDPVVRQLAVLFYASFPWADAVEYARPALTEGHETEVTNSAETLVPTAIRMLAGARARPIAVGEAKRLVKG